MPALSNQGWEARYEQIKPKVQVHIPAGLLVSELEAAGLLTPDEGDRAILKIRLVEPFVTRMVLNMIKGTVKYPTDEWSAEMWADAGMDDQADGINYSLLLKDRLRKDGQL
jgi:hypothetical protein